MHVFVYLYVCACVCVYMYTYILVYIHVNIHIYTLYLSMFKYFYISHMTYTEAIFWHIQQSELGKQSNDPLGHLLKADKNYSILFNTDTCRMCDFASLGLSFLIYKNEEVGQFLRFSPAQKILLVPAHSGPSSQLRSHLLTLSVLFNSVLQQPLSSLNS